MLELIVNVSPTTAVVIPVPPVTVSVSPTVFAVAVPLSLAMFNQLGASLLIVSVLPATIVPIPVPPAIVIASSVVVGVTVPLSLTTLVNLFSLSTANVIVSVILFVVIVSPLPPAKVNVSFTTSATTLFCPDTAIVSNKFCEPPAPPVFVIVTVSPTILVVIPVPPVMVNVSVIAFAVVVPVSAVNVANTFCELATVPGFHLPAEPSQISAWSVDGAVVSTLLRSLNTAAATLKSALASALVFVKYKLFVPSDKPSVSAILLGATKAKFPAPSVLNKSPDEPSTTSTFSIVIKLLGICE